MKSWFFISVAIVLLGFSTVYLIVKDANNNLEFAPGSVSLCKNTESLEDSFRSDEGESDRLPGNYEYSNLCRKIGTKPPKFAFKDGNGACPNPQSDWQGSVTLPPKMICGVGHQLGAVKSPEDPENCAEDCLDMGVTETTGPVIVESGFLGLNKNIFCRVKKERTCVDQPS